MMKCAACGTIIVFGGKRTQGLRFCNDKCFSKGNVPLLARQLPSDVVEIHAARIHAGICPECKGPGPVDVRMSYRVISFVTHSASTSIPHVCCFSCGSKHRLKDAVVCVLLGWWGLPLGPPMTLLSLFHNLRGLAHLPDERLPSDDLRDHVRMELARKVVANTSCRSLRE